MTRLANLDAPASSDREWTAATSYTLGLLTVIYALNYLDRQILSLVLPLIKADLHVSDTALGLVTGFAFVLFYSIMGVPIARLADRANRRNIVAVGCAFWSAMTFATGFVQNIWQLAATRFLMGAGEACGIAPSNSMVADLVSAPRRPFALAVLTAGNGMGSLLLFPVVGWIALQYGWHACFFAAGCAGIAVTVLFVLTVREPARRGGRSVKSTPDTLFRALGYLAQSRAYVLILCGGAFMGVSLYASIVWTSSFLVRIHGFNMAEVGSTLGPIKGVCGVAGVLIGGLVSMRLGRRDPRMRLWVPGLACVLVLPAEILFLLPADVPTSLVGLALASFLSSAHLGPIYAACLSVAKPTLHATASAVFLFVANLVGQIGGPLLVGRLNDFWRDVYGDAAIRYSMLVGATCAVVGGAFFILAARHIGADTQPVDTV